VASTSLETTTADAKLITKSCVASSAVCPMTSTVERYLQACENYEVLRSRQIGVNTPTHYQYEQYPEEAAYGRYNPMGASDPKDDSGNNTGHQPSDRTSFAWFPLSDRLFQMATGPSVRSEVVLGKRQPGSRRVIFAVLLFPTADDDAEAQARETWRPLFLNSPGKQAHVR
jgi:hypothetical protein